ncbi:hypothetical protein OF83DRAFT_104766 [Amylostereum chailletii]|nr:hypothetical protein OF83DRAFT_104766 [Amylostereum chailletii]
MKWTRLRSGRKQQTKRAHVPAAGAILSCADPLIFQRSRRAMNAPTVDRPCLHPHLSHTLTLPRPSSFHNPSSLSHRTLGTHRPLPRENPPPPRRNNEERVLSISGFNPQRGSLVVGTRSAPPPPPSSQTPPIDASLAGGKRRCARSGLPPQLGAIGRDNWASCRGRFLGREGTRRGGGAVGLLLARRKGGRRKGGFWCGDACARDVGDSS